MDYKLYREPESEINLDEALWGLFAQWKAILLVALLLAMVLPGVSLLKDTFTYNAQIRAAQVTAQVQNNMSDTERTESILSKLSESDRKAVERVLKQQEAADAQEKYLNESLLLNSDLTNERTLVLRYYLKSDDGSSLQTLADAYNVFILSTPSIERIRPAIDGAADQKYISELMSTYYNTVPDSGFNSLLFRVNIVLPIDIDTTVLQNTVDSLITERYERLKELIGEHSIQLLGKDEIKSYDSVSMEKRITIINSINSLRNIVKTNLATLTDSQKETFEAITSDMSKKTQNTSSALDSIAKPSFNKKLALLGFAGGLVLYVLAYIIYIISKGGVMSLVDLGQFAKSRPLGEIRYRCNHKGFERLLHSKIIERIRYHGLADVESQVDTVSSTISAVCENISLSSVSTLKLAGKECMAKKVIDGIVSSIRGKGVNAETIDVSGTLNERELLPLTDAILIVEKGEKSSDVWRIAELCHEYNVRILGVLFIGEM